MGDYANTILLAWPYPGERALPDALRDLLAADSWLPDLDEPGRRDRGERQRRRSPATSTADRSSRSPTPKRTTAPPASAT